MHKKITYLAIATLLFITTSKATCAEFMRGADISTHTKQVADGVIYNEGGTPKNLYTILQNHDFNWIRIRLFHTPSSSADYGVSQINLAYVTALGAQVKAQGFKFLLDIHYSDTWADPSNQTIPAAWSGYSHSQLVTAVHDYTQNVITTLRTNGAMPDMVQIGNEIPDGMLWPDGRISVNGWGNFTDLVKAGILGVSDGRGTETMPEIMIHIDRGGDATTTEWFFDNLIANGVAFDVIGQSFYPEWHGTLSDLTNCLNFMAANYTQDIIVAETGEYYTYVSGKTPEVQKAFLEDLIACVQATPNGKGRGVCYWEPAWVWNSGAGYRALFQPISGNWQNVNMLMGMEAFDIDDAIPPAAPTGLSATAGNSTVSLNWNDNTEEDLGGYNVYRSTTSGSGYSKINSSLLSSSDYSDSNVDGYVTYYYVTTAVDTSTNESNYSSEASAMPTDTIPPAAPTGLTATAGDGTVALNWNDNSESDLNGYNVYRATTSGGAYTKLNGSLLSSSNYTDSSVSNGTTYYYIVTAVDTSSNESSDSSEVSATPQIVTDVGILGSWVTGTTHAKESGNKRALIFVAHAKGISSTAVLSTVTYGGRSMTKVVERRQGSSTSTRVYVTAFILNDANINAATTTTFTPSWSATPSYTAYESVFLSDVNQISLYAATGNNGVSSGTSVSTAALTTNDGDMVIESAASSVSGTYTVTTGWTKDVELTTANPDGMDGHKSATGVSETPSITQSSGNHALIGFVVNHTPTVTAAPEKATSPSPASEATGIGITTDLSWTAGSGATSHDVYFGTVSPGTFQGNQAGTTFDTGTMTKDTTYYWRIDEKNAGGTTTGDVWNFTTVSAPPAAPTGLSATAGNGTVSLNWNDNSESDLGGYNIYRSTTSGSGYSKLNSSLLSSSDYIDNTVTNGITYYYVVTAVDTQDNESDYSDETSSVPDYQNCADVQAGGDKLLADLNGDCFVNIEDLETISAYWLSTDCAANNNCDGADFAPTNGIVDFLDFSDFAVQWMQCNDPQTAGCITNW